jgi:hypothetical protein
MVSKSCDDLNWSNLFTLPNSFFQTASTTAEADLPSTHPIRLGLALNYSVFYYEIMNSPERYKYGILLFFCW